MRVPKILFICFANTCRSPMAEAMARSMAGGRAQVYSAGLYPTRAVAALAVETVEMMGYDGSHLESKGLDEVPLDQMDVIVSLLGPEGLEVVPRHLQAERLAWAIRDPYGEDEEVYLSSARVLERNIRRLLDDVMEPAP